MISHFLFNFINFNFIIVTVIVTFSTKLLTLGILFSTVVKEAVVAKLVMLGISFLTSFMLALTGISTNLSTSGLSALLFKFA